MDRPDPVRRVIPPTITIKAIRNIPDHNQAFSSLRSREEIEFIPVLETAKLQIDVADAMMFIITNNDSLSQQEVRVRVSQMQQMKPI